MKVTDIHFLDESSTQILASFENKVGIITVHPEMNEDLQLSDILSSLDSHSITYPLDTTHEHIIHSGMNHDNAIITITNYHVRMILFILF